MFCSAYTSSLQQVEAVDENASFLSTALCRNRVSLTDATIDSVPVRYPTLPADRFAQKQCRSIYRINISLNRVFRDSSIVALDLGPIRLRLHDPERCRRRRS
jgi:hypothetical protein